MRASARWSSIPTTWTAPGRPSSRSSPPRSRDFRRSGKKVIAYGSYFLQSQYYLAAQADEVYLDPFGFVLLDGYDRYRMFFKDALDKLVGRHAPVPRRQVQERGRDRSRAATCRAEDREESEAYLQALWRGYRAAVAQSRAAWRSEAIVALRQQLCRLGRRRAAATTARVAKDSGLVTGLGTRQQVESRLIELVGVDPSGKSYRQVSVSDYLRATHAEEKQRGKGARRWAWSWPAADPGRQAAAGHDRR